MLHHNEGIAQIAQTFHGSNEFVIVPLMQTDAGFVQHIQHAGERTADLSGQTDALAFAAGQGGRAAGQRQIPQSHALQKTQPFLYFLENGRADHLFSLSHLGSLDKFQFLIDALVTEIRNVDATHRHGKAGGFQTLAMAVGAFFAGHHQRDLLLDPLAAGLPEPAFQIGNDTLKLVVIGAGTKDALPLHFDTLLTGAVQQRFEGLFAQFSDGRIQCKAEPLAKGFVGHL